jgi:hypothetical protein
MKKLFFAVAIIIAAFVTKANAVVNHHLLALNRTDTIKPKAKMDTITPKLKRDTITPVIIKHASVAMSDKQLNHILNIMRQKRNDAQKIKVLKLGIKNKGLMLAQLTTLLNQFLHDSSKLSIAEYAYPNTVDYQGYGGIDNLFATQDSKDKLDDFLRHNK